MAYNSDGYIMIDFTEVDFRRTNQTIEGLFKRCVDVIGTNKFILVINANGRTPLPATCSFTNNQYVIDTCIYMFAISSNDNLFIRRNDVPASDIIDDSSISVDKTWSSNKIDSELDTKADASALADYQPLLTAVSPISISADDEISVDLSSKQNVLTAVSPISISEDDEISVDLSGKQNVLTAGDNITILNDVISSKPIKSFTYTGTGTVISEIEFSTIPTYIMGIFGDIPTYHCNISGFYFGCTYAISSLLNLGLTNAPLIRTVNITYNINKILIEGSSANYSLNNNGTVYTVYYI